MDRHDPAELIERCINGDDVARAQFIEGYGDTIRKAARIKIRQLSDSAVVAIDLDDIYHEVLLRVFDEDCRALRRLKQPKSLHAWLMTITNNQIISRLRKDSTAEIKRQTLAREATPEAAYAADASAVRAEEEQALSESIGTLPRDEQLILKWYYLEDMKYYEIAETLGISINTVASKLRRAKRKLRERLIEKLR